MNVDRIRSATQALSGGELVAAVLDRVLGPGHAKRLMTAAERARALVRGGGRRLARATRGRELAELYRNRLDHLVEVTQPLVLISQIQRSGGTLLSQLFDMHPQCHAHPYELYVGHPDKTTWPSLDLASPSETWFDILFEPPAAAAFARGYTKYSAAMDQGEAFPFVFPPKLQRAIFARAVAAAPIDSVRRIFDCYMTAYFNAWLDNQNLYGSSKRWITAFVPRLAMRPGNLERFFEVYPDGRFVSIVRDAKSWYASARTHARYNHSLDGSIDGALGLWMMSCRATIEARRRYGARTYVLTYEQLVSRTEKSMRALAEYLGIEFRESLLSPTFNGFPIRADSVVKVAGYGVSTEPTSRYRSELSREDIDYIDRHTAATYEEVCAAAGEHR